jgi:transposase
MYIVVLFSTNNVDTMTIICKECGSDDYVKAGKVRGKQRYKCKSCGFYYVLGDERVKVSGSGKALAMLLYGSGKASYGFISRLFNVSRPAVLKWVRKFAGELPEPTMDGTLSRCN